MKTIAKYIRMRLLKEHRLKVVQGLISDISWIIDSVYKRDSGQASQLICDSFLRKKLLDREIKKKDVILVAEELVLMLTENKISALSRASVVWILGKVPCQQSIKYLKSILLDFNIKKGSFDELYQIVAAISTFLMFNSSHKASIRGEERIQCIRKLHSLRSCGNKRTENLIKEILKYNSPSSSSPSSNNKTNQLDKP